MDPTGQQSVILVGIGGSAASATALGWAAAEARRRGAQLQVVRAWQPHPARALYAGTAGLRSELAAAERLNHDVRSVLGEADGLDLVVQLIEGSAERILCEASADADLLVLGSGSQSPVAQADPQITDRPVGPVIRACLSRARCPIVIISPASARRPHLAALAYQLS